MEHSVRFSETLEELYHVNGLYKDHNRVKHRHSFYDWFLIPEERYSVEPPDTKEEFVDIPGANGALDISEALTMYPVYKTIDGSMSFLVSNEKKGISLTNLEYEIFWNEIFSDIKAFLHGKQRYFLIEDNPEWYYFGRFSVSKYDTSDKVHSKIVISYKLEPYRKWCWRTNDNPFFDSIDLRVGNVSQSGIRYYRNDKQNIIVNSEEYRVLTNFYCGPMPTIPKFTIKPLDDEPVNITVRFWNPRIGIGSYEVNITPPADTSKIAEDGSFDFIDRHIIFTNLDQPTIMQAQDFAFDVKGVGIMSLDYEIGAL